MKNRLNRIKVLLIILNVIFGSSRILGRNYTNAFLEIGVGARPLGMGGAFCSLANDGTAFYWNPSGLALLKHSQFSGMAGPQFGSFDQPLSTYHHIGYTQCLQANTTIAINWIRLAVDDIPQYPELSGSRDDRLQNPSLRPTGEPIGYFSDEENGFFFSFAKLLKSKMDMGWAFHEMKLEIPLGINLKWIRHSLQDYSATGLGVDVGTMARLYLNDFFLNEKLGIFTAGIHLRDLAGTRMTWNTKTKRQDTVHLNVKWGISYQQPLPMEKSSLAISFDRDSRWGGRNRFGLEYFGYDIFGIRVGIDQNKFTGGASLRFWKVQVDYAFMQHEIDGLHRISGSFIF